MFQSPIGTNKTYAQRPAVFVITKFQSPIGTNKTINRKRSVTGIPMFQSPIGTNKTIVIAGYVILLLSFNPL